MRKNLRKSYGHVLVLRDRTCKWESAACRDATWDTRYMLHGVNQRANFLAPAWFAWNFKCRLHQKIKKRYSFSFLLNSLIRDVWRSRKEMKWKLERMFHIPISHRYKKKHVKHSFLFRNLQGILTLLCQRSRRLGFETSRCDSNLTQLSKKDRDDSGVNNARLSHSCLSSIINSRIGRIAISRREIFKRSIKQRRSESIHNWPIMRDIVRHLLLEF